MGQQRFLQLSKELTGDIRDDSVILRVPGGAPAFDVPAWSRRVAKLLVPTAIETFPRHRWVNSLETLSELSLLVMHNMLVRAGCKWLSKSPLAPVRRRPMAGAACGAAWALSASEDEGDIPGADLPQEVQVALASEKDANPWVVLNDKNEKMPIAGLCPVRETGLSRCASLYLSL